MNISVRFLVLQELSNRFVFCVKGICTAKG